ncbi:MAG: methyltransferase domain-containing protein [Gammaproteobacteria bacterium]|nr:methyltransferase domain-containing protein [Gammaproteobacteria bacterium]
MTNTPKAADSVSDYYSALTSSLPILSVMNEISLGLYGPDTKSEQEAIIRSNSTLVQGCKLGPESHVLDSGSGHGSTSVWLAQTFGCQVTGITNCEPQVPVARDIADQAGVSDLVNFCQGDFMNLPFPDSSFDLVINQESFCYATDKDDYLRGVYRVLKPGGKWQAMETLLTGVPLTNEQQQIHESMQQNCVIPPMVSVDSVLASLKHAGFTDIRDRSYDSEAMVHTDIIQRRWAVWQLFFMPKSDDSETSRAGRGLIGSACDFGKGLEQGVFTYSFVTGTKPNSSS